MSAQLSQASTRQVHRHMRSCSRPTTTGIMDCISQQCLEDRCWFCSGALAPSCSGFTEQGLALLTGLLVCLWSMLPASQSLNPEPGVCVCDMRCGRQWGQLVLEAAEGELERAVQPLSSMAEPCGESGQHRRLACALFAAGEVSHCLRPGRHHLGAGACALPWVDPEP